MMFDIDCPACRRKLLEKSCGRTLPQHNGFYGDMIRYIACFLLFFGSTAEAKFINTFLCRISHSYNSGDENILAKFDIILGTKAQHNDKFGDDGDMWEAIHALNGTMGYAPYTEIYPYQQAHLSNSEQDDFMTIYTNNLARHLNARNHPSGNIAQDNPDFLLIAVGGGFVMQAGDPDSTYALDFGNSSFHNYAIRALKDDFVGQPWEADGVYSDLTLAYSGGSVSGVPEKYPTNSEWSTAMNGFLNAVTEGLHLSGQKFACNRGLTRFSDGVAAWLALDQLTTPPDAILEEGAFVLLWGGNANFVNETEWKSQVDVLSSIRNSKVLYMSHVNTGSVDGSTVDTYGAPVTFWEALWYGMGSYLLGKNDIDDNSYFMMRYTTGYAPFDLYFPEYDEIDLGEAVAGYKVSRIDGTNIYWREFSDGYVYVNPTNIDVASIPLPDKCKQRTHENLSESLDTLSDQDTISLKAHRAAILYKSELSVPLNLSIISIIP